MPTPIKKTLRNGDVMDICRFVFPADCGNVPDWLLPLFQLESPECWNLYYEDIFSNPVEGITDYCYAGVINGVPCGRMWFGYSQKTGSGNFGNVITVPEFRRRGIMNELLSVLIEDFYRSDALFCSCDAAARAAAAYESAGFKRIFSPALKPMALVHPRAGSFEEIRKKAYSDTAGAKVRPGVFADRFDCDKLLMYTQEVYKIVVPPEEISSYLSLWYELVLKNKASVAVLEASSGFCAGYAFRLENGMIGSVLHPRFSQYKEELEQAVQK